MSINIGVVGYRGFTDYDRLSTILDEFISKLDSDNIVIVSGGAPGADTLAEQYAKENNLDTIIHKPEWYPVFDRKRGTKVYNRNAALDRNTLIVKDSNYLIAFLSTKSKGTHDTINKAKKKKIPVTIIKID